MNVAFNLQESVKTTAMLALAGVQGDLELQLQPVASEPEFREFCKFYELRLRWSSILTTRMEIWALFIRQSKAKNLIA